MARHEAICIKPRCIIYLKAAQKVVFIFCAFGKWMCLRLFFWRLLANKPSLETLLVHHAHLLHGIPTRAETHLKALQNYSDALTLNRKFLCKNIS
jgi:hypothetical protein